MDRKRLDQLERELSAMRRSAAKARDLESLAKRLGRTKVDRGKEPVWENPSLGVYPIAIPHHGGKDIAVGTKHSILDQLENDILAWEDHLDD